MLEASAKPRTKKPKPIKPHKDFPLYPHSSGRWAKKVCGVVRYFGSFEDGHQAALEKWLEQKDDLLAGRKPRPAHSRQLKLGDACNLYLDYVEQRIKDDNKLSVEDEIILAELDGDNKRTIAELCAVLADKNKSSSAGYVRGRVIRLEALGLTVKEFPFFGVEPGNEMDFCLTPRIGSSRLRANF